MTMVAGEHRRASGATTWAWRSGPCAALEHRFEVFVEPGGQARHVVPVVAPFLARDRGLLTESRTRYEVRVGADPRYLSAFADGERLATGKSVVELLGGLSWHVNRAVIERSTERFVLMHAAAATTSGITVVLAADMESGKTTTVAGLLRNGYDYVTDEAVAIDPDSGWITVFPKTLSLDRGSWPLFPECEPPDPGLVRTQWFVPPARLGAQVAAHRAPPPAVILFPKYEAGATTEVRPVSKAEAVHELGRMTFNFPRNARRNLDTISRLVRRATVARLRIGNLDDAVNAVDELVSQRILEDL